MTKKSGWFNKIKSTFVETDVIPTTESAEVSETSAQTQEATTFNDSKSVAPVYTGSVTNTVTGQFDQSTYDGLLEEIEKHDIDGIDYLEFTKSKKALDVMPGMSEQQKVTAAFATLKASAPNLSKESLLTTADHYLGVLQNEKKEFEGAIKAMTEEQVIAREKQVSDKETLIQQKLEAIQVLNEEIALEKENITTLKHEVVNETARISGISSNFIATLQVVQNEIDTNKKNISQFIVEIAPTA